MMQEPTSKYNTYHYLCHIEITSHSHEYIAFVKIKYIFITTNSLISCPVSTFKRFIDNMGWAMGARQLCLMQMILCDRLEFKAMSGYFKLNHCITQTKSKV